MKSIRGKETNRSKNLTKTKKLKDISERGIKIEELKSIYRIVHTEDDSGWENIWN